MTTTRSALRTPLRPILLPNEHGGWGFLLEPILLALLIAPSWAGTCVALAACGAFLARHPLRLVLSDHLRGRLYPRTRVAARVAFGYGLVSVLAGFGTLALAAPLWWWPLLLAAPLVFSQLWYDARLRSRELIPELTGAVALGVTAPLIILAGGASIELALLTWFVLAARAVTSILYVRARLRLERGEVVPVTPVLAAQVIAVLLCAGLALLQVLPWLTVAAFLVLLARALHGLSSWRRPAKAAVVGIRELLLGVLTVILTAVPWSV